MANKVEDKLTPEGKKLQQELKKLAKLRVKIGFQQGDAVYESEDGGSADICDVAMFNELGTETAPSRPFLRDSCDNHADEINGFYQAQLALLKAGKTTAEAMMKSIGVFHKGLVQAEIVDGEFEPNTPATIKRKGSDKPLIDTGKMRQSVNFVIEEKK